MDRELILALSGVTCRYPGAPRDSLQGVSLEVRAGEFHAVLGPNGSGKTTLVRAALGLVRPAAGRVEILGRPASGWSRRDLARVVGVLPQREDNLFPQRVRETVLLGRYPYLSLLGGVRAEDRAAVERALVVTHHVNLAARFADRVLLLAEGRPAGAGAPGDVLTRETAERVFAWPVSIAPFEGRPQMIPLRQRKDAP